MNEINFNTGHQIEYGSSHLLEEIEVKVSFSQPRPISPNSIIVLPPRDKQMQKLSLEEKIEQLMKTAFPFKQPIVISEILNAVESLFNQPHAKHQALINMKTKIQTKIKKLIRTIFSIKQSIVIEKLLNTMQDLFNRSVKCPFSINMKIEIQNKDKLKAEILGIVDVYHRKAIYLALPGEINSEIDLGTGACKKIRRAWNLASAEEVAYSITNLEEVPQLSILQEKMPSLNKSKLRGLIKEAHYLQQLNKDNVRITQLYAACLNDKLFISVMKCYGPNLATYLSFSNQKVRNTSLSDRKLIEMSVQLLETIYYLHNKKIIHGDIKLENILVSDEGLVLADFNTSCQINDEDEDEDENEEGESELLLKNGITGTPDYFSFQTLEYLYVVRRSEWGELRQEGTNKLLTAKRWMKDDIWSVAIVLYILWAKQAPTWYSKINVYSVKAIMLSIGLIIEYQDEQIPAQAKAARLVRNMLEKNLEQRLNAQESLERAQDLLKDFSDNVTQLTLTEQFS